MTRKDHRHSSSTSRVPRSHGFLVRLLLLASIAGTLFVFASATAQTKGIPPAGRAQIDALMSEKALRTPAQRKIDSRLLLEAKRQRGDALFESVPRLRRMIPVDQTGMVLVDIRARVSNELLIYVRQIGGVIVSAFPQYGAIRAEIPLNRVELLAERGDITFLRPALPPMLNKVDTSEGDVAHASDTARRIFGIDGTGVKIGVLSDSVDYLEYLQYTEDLPPAVTVLPGQSGIPGTSEGTAMLEIVYDLAPGADLLFATAYGGEAQFAQNITDLAIAGADIIVDDVLDAWEPVFQDGIIAQAVNAFTHAGGHYFSAAGNDGNFNDGTSGVWEGDFVLAPNNLPIFDDLGYAAHDFGSGSPLNTLTEDPPWLIRLQWSDPWGGASNDYDLFLLNTDGTEVIDFSTNYQDGDDFPFEYIDSSFVDDTGLTLAVGIWSGYGRFLHLSTHGGQLAHATDGQISGHAAATDAFAVAAVDWLTAGGDPFTGGVANPVELFSSDGPRRIFFDTEGTPITPGDLSSTGGLLRAKPEIAAADGVSTATPTPGFNPFFGTSAAAPHAAAIAGLLEESGNLTPDGLYLLFAQTALDIETPGWDRDSGWGIVMADRALGTTTDVPIGTCQIDDLYLEGIPNDGPQIFRTCQTIHAENGIFDDVNLVSPSVTLGGGFRSNGPLSIRTTRRSTLLNDTGITFGGDYLDGNNATCTSNILAPQDCHQGRDFTHNDDSDGHAGFSFTKLDFDGNQLPASATDWSCVLDNVTGLIWEVKTDDGGIHDKNNTYRWGGKTALGDGSFGDYYSDWDTLVDETNQEGLCGFTDGWRVPNVKELENLPTRDGSDPAIDSDYFPNASASHFWSSSPGAFSDGIWAWVVDFYTGRTGRRDREFNLPLRLVRSGE